MITPSSSLKVMQLISNLEIGGAQEVVRTLAENLNKAGCVSVVCTFKDGPLRAEIEKMGIPVEILPERRHSIVAFFGFIKEVLLLRRALMKVVLKYQVDVIQTHLLRSMDFLALSLRLGGSPIIYWTFHNDKFDLREDHLLVNRWLLKPKRFSHHLLYRLGAKRVDGLIAVSADVKTSILKTMKGIPANKISVILNCVDISRYGKDLNRVALRSNLGFGMREHLMALVATFKRQKGHKFLIDAVAEIIPKFPELHVLFVGDGELRTEFLLQVQELGLENNIHFLGLRGDIPDLLGACDSFVLPSLWEGLPMALIEAMASKLPIIATDVSGARQVMVPGKTGLMVEPENVPALAVAIMKLLNNPVQAKEMGAQARERVGRLFSAQKQAQEYIRLFEKQHEQSRLQLASTSGEKV